MKCQLIRVMHCSVQELSVHTRVLPRSTASAAHLGLWRLAPVPLWLAFALRHVKHVGKDDTTSVNPLTSDEIKPSKKY